MGSPCDARWENEVKFEIVRHVFTDLAPNQVYTVSGAAGGRAKPRSRNRREHGRWQTWARQISRPVHGRRGDVGG